MSRNYVHLAIELSGGFGAQRISRPGQDWSEFEWLFRHFLLVLQSTRLNDRLEIKYDIRSLVFLYREVLGQAKMDMVVRDITQNFSELDLKFG